MLVIKLWDSGFVFSRYSFRYSKACNTHLTHSLDSFHGRITPECSRSLEQIMRSCLSSLPLNQCRAKQLVTNSFMHHDFWIQVLHKPLLKESPMLLRDYQFYELGQILYLICLALTRSFDLINLLQIKEGILKHWNCMNILYDWAR